MSAITNPTPEVLDSKQLDKEKNFENIRRSLQAEQQARQQAEAKIAEMELQMKESQRSTRDEDDEDDEPYIDRKKLKRELTALKKETGDDVDRRVQAGVHQALQVERQSSYLRENPDFQSVMSSDVVQKFADSHPRLAENILKMPEGFERQKLVYENIKALGLDKPKPKEPSIQDTINQKMRSPFMPSPGTAGPGYSSQGDFSESGQKNAYDKLKELQKRLRI